MLVTRDEAISSTISGELDQIVVARVGRNHPRRIHRIGKPYGFLFDALAGFSDLACNDVVSARDPGIEQSLAYFGHQLRACNQLKASLPPQVKEC